MKLSLEQIATEADKSFKLLLTPGLNDLYYWHFHPEWEIVYVEGVSGTRHIGDHISKYTDSDLVLIGSNIPHLNFDYGANAECAQVVLQMRDEFMQLDFFSLPEMAEASDLFSDVKGAIAFHGDSKRIAGAMMKEIPAMNAFDQLMQLIRVFKFLGASKERELISAQPVLDKASIRQQARLQQLRRYVEAEYRNEPGTREAAELLNLSMPAFCRYLRKATGGTFTDYVNRFRIEEARKLLLQGSSVTDTCYEVGFGNLAHFNRTFRKMAGENPSIFRKRHQV